MASPHNQSPPTLTSHALALAQTSLPGKHMLQSLRLCTNDDESKC